ncbi:hypothetical protein K5M79_18895 [Shewanella xiamenensis]|nr:hypothetical protein [Shewanella xiamenensis]
MDIIKISDLKDTVESAGDITVWKIDGEEFVYKKGDEHVKSRAGLGCTWEIWPITGNDKKVAKSRVFSIIKS